MCPASCEHVCARVSTCEHVCVRVKTAPIARKLTLRQLVFLLLDEVVENAHAIFKGQHERNRVQQRAAPHRTAAEFCNGHITVPYRAHAHTQDMHA